jgi:DNA (cytosine-5)-methyltransferase 1
MARIVREVGPRFVFVENSPALTFRGLDRVLGDLATLGYNAKWGVLSAAGVGAPHLRERIWIVANSNDDRFRQPLQSLAKHRRSDSADAWSDGKIRHVADTGCGWRSSDETQLANAKGFGFETSNNGDRINGESRGSWDCEPCGNHGGTDQDMADADRKRLGKRWSAVVENANDFDNGGTRSKRQATPRDSWWQSEPDVGRVAHGVAARVDRLRAIGNGQVSAVAALAWKALSDEG